MELKSGYFRPKNARNDDHFNGQCCLGGRPCCACYGETPPRCFEQRAARPFSTMAPSCGRPKQRFGGYLRRFVACGACEGLPRAANPRNLAAKAPAVPFLAKKTFFRGKVWRGPTFGALGPLRLQPRPEVGARALADLRASPLEGSAMGFAPGGRVVSAEAPVRVSIGRNRFRGPRAVLPPWMPALPVRGRRVTQK